MFIKAIKDYDADSGEAELIVSDGTYELLCYCHPCENANIGAEIIVVSSLFAEDIMRIDSKEYLIAKGEDYFSYHLQGKVVDRQKPIIAIGDIKIQLDKPIAKDIQVDEFVEFYVYRLDCEVI